MARPGLPLRPTLVTGVTALILLSAGLVGGSAYLSSRKAVASLWHKAGGEIAQEVTQRTLRFLEPAEPYLELTRALVAQHKLELSQRDAAFDYFRAALLANPSFTWASYGGSNGIYIAAYRPAEGPHKGEIEATYREAMSDETQAPRWRDYALTADGHWSQVRETRELYDPRTRGWYRAALEQQRATWIEPFIFRSNGQPGFSYVAPVPAAAGSSRGAPAQGVLAVEFEVRGLSRFLSELHVGQSGRVYLVSKSGLVIGHPDGIVTEASSSGVEIAHAQSHPDLLLRQAWAELQHRGGAPRNFAFGRSLAMALPFPPDQGIDWITLSIVPQSEFFGEARRQAWVALAIGLFCMLLAAGLGALLATRVSDGMRTIGDEMDRIARFELTDQRLASAPSVVREVNAISEATDRMKAGLRSFAHYVPTELVQDLLASGEEAKLGGQKRVLTTLFCDLAGFTTISEGMAPDALVEALGAYFAAMSEEVRAQGGTVDKFIGDAVMAFWGAPRAMPGHALMACRAALGMHGRMRKLQEAWARAGVPDFAARIGINTGESLVGNIGSSARMNYTAMGDAVNLASRLEGLNKLYGTSILLGEATAEAVRGQMLVRAVDFVAVMGRAKAELVYELVGALDEVKPELVQAAAEQRAALELYRARRFMDAAVAFERLHRALGPESGSSARVLGERCRRLASAPPPPDWSGALQMHDK